MEEPVFRDYRGIACPMNFARITVDLFDIPVGGRLKVLIDDGEPSINVPRSLEREGQKILRSEKHDSYWTLLIEKAAD